MRADYFIQDFRNKVQPPFFKRREEPEDVGRQEKVDGFVYRDKITYQAFGDKLILFGFIEAGSAFKPSVKAS